MVTKQRFRGKPDSGWWRSVLINRTQVILEVPFLKKQSHEKNNEKEALKFEGCGARRPAIHSTRVSRLHSQYWQSEGGPLHLPLCPTSTPLPQRQGCDTITNSDV